MNQPDLVLFVGEALVGNEAVDQLAKFNRALIDHAQTDQPQTIDGIVLTKFDTIDDCMTETGKIVADAYRAAAWEQGPDLVLPRYACLLLDD